MTLDAMGCRKAIARRTREQQADYMLRVQENHKGLHDRMEVTFALERARGFAGCSHDYAETVGKDHGHIGIRHCRTTSDPDRDGCDLASLARVECERRGGGRLPHFHFQSVPEAKLLMQAVRKHWSIQNARHRVMDIAFGEDDNRIRTGHAAHNMTVSGASPTSGWMRPGTRTACAG